MPTTRFSASPITAQTQTFTDPDHQDNTVEFTFYNLTKIDYPDSTDETFTYDDANGNVLTYTDRAGQTWTYTYNARGQVLTATNPEGGVITHTYNADATLATSTDSDTGQTAYAYDDSKRLTQITRPGDATLKIAYNLNNQVTSVTDERENIYTYDYDDNGNLASITDPDNNQTLFSHDKMDRVDAATNARDKQSRFTYDSMNRPASFIDPDNNTVRFGYNTRGWLTKVTDSLTGATVDFSYDNDGRITIITRSSGVGTTFTWDGASRLTRIQHKTGAATLADLQYTRNAAGEVTALDYDLPLDPAEHLASATDDLTFDAASGISTAGYTYDDLGRQTAAPGQTFTWDGASRLIATADATLTYNGLSDLRTRQSGGVTIRYHYNHALDLHPLVGEYNVTAGAWKRFYVLDPGGQLLYAIDPTVAPANAAAVSFYHFDGTGNTLFLTDADGSVTDTYAYSPYSRLLAHDGTGDQPFTFAGAWQIRREGDADLYQMRARYYDARTAAFLSREPLWPRLATPAALNPYQYAARDPNRFVDITGEAEEAYNDLWHYDKFGDTWRE